MFFKYHVIKNSMQSNRKPNKWTCCKSEMKSHTSRFKKRNRKLITRKQRIWINTIHNLRLLLVNYSIIIPGSLRHRKRIKTRSFSQLKLVFGDRLISLTERLQGQHRAICWCHSYRYLAELKSSCAPVLCLQELRIPGINRSRGGKGCIISSCIQLLVAFRLIKQRQQSY